jgi:hypothetical protein
MPIRGSRGFTLLQVVATLIVASVMGAMFVEFMGFNLWESVKPVVRLRDGLTVQQIMESMTADYRKLMVTDATFLSTFRTHVQNGNISSNDPYFGPYVLLVNDYVDFDDNGTELSSGSRILKVKISYQGQTLVTLFTK